MSSKLAIAVIFLLVQLGGVVANAKDIPSFAAEVKTRLEKNNLDAIAWINSLGTPSEVCELYDRAVRELYWLDKGSKNLLIIGRAGFDYCLNVASKSVTPDVIARFKSQAKTIAFDVAANSWPGWGDEGVVIQSNEVRDGYDFARINLDLAIELKKPNDKVAIAHWLVAAMQLALSQYTEARTSAVNAIEYAHLANDKIFESFMVGFKGLIELASGNKSEGAQNFEDGINKLKAINNENANGYIGQLEVANKIFVK